MKKHIDKNLNVDKIDAKMSILVDTLKKMQVQQILQNDNKTLKAENTAIMKKLDTLTENLRLFLFK